MFSLGHIYFSRDKHIPVEFWYTYFTWKVNLTKKRTFWLQIYTTNVGIHRLLHNIHNFFILFLEQLNQMFSIGILGQVWYLIVSIPDLCTLTYFGSFGRRT